MSTMKQANGAYTAHSQVLNVDSRSGFPKMVFKYEIKLLILKGFRTSLHKRVIYITTTNIQYPNISTNFMAYGTRSFNAAFTRALQ